MSDKEKEALGKIRAGVLGNIGSVVVHDFAEMKRLVRKATAAGLGFDSNEYATPFPGTPGPVSISINEAAPKFGIGKWLLAGLLGAGILGGGIGLGALAIGKFGKLEPSLPATTPNGIVNNTGKPIRVYVDPAGNRYRWKYLPDGEWSEWKPKPEGPITVP